MGQILRACSVCGAPFRPRHARHRACPLHETYGNESRSPTTRTRPSSSTERDRIRAAVLTPGAVCAIRLPGCEGDAAVVDHIVSAADGGRYELQNLRPACEHCNSVRGGQQASTLEHGYDGRNVGPRHVGGARSAPVVGPTRLA